MCQFVKIPPSEDFIEDISLPEHAGEQVLLLVVVLSVQLPAKSEQFLKC